MEKTRLAEIKANIRKEKLEMRRAMDKAVAEELSHKICNKIVASAEFKKAKIIFIYNHINNEVNLALLAKYAYREGKRVTYPLCFSYGEMKAFEPAGADAFVDGAFGIKEPDETNSKLIEPEEIDLVICPLTAFDENGGRIGMGGGYYDKYLPRCVNAFVAAAAYEFQKTDRALFECTDIAVDAVFTEKNEYR